MRAFISAVVPVWSFFAVPANVQEVLYRIDRRGGGVFVIAVAYIGFVGGWLLDRLAGAYFVGRLVTAGTNATSLEGFAREASEVVRLAQLVIGATTVMVAAGAVALIVTIVRIELRAAARNAEVEKELGPE